MKIKDIVNRNNVTLTNCEHEPIHVPGKIQPHGFLIGLDLDRKIDFCTENISLFVSVLHTEALGKSFADVFGLKAEQQIYDYINKEKVQDVFPLEIDLLGKVFQVSIHKFWHLYSGS